LTFPACSWIDTMLFMFFL